MNKIYFQHQIKIAAAEAAAKAPTTKGRGRRARGRLVERPATGLPSQIFCKYGPLCPNRGACPFLHYTPLGGRSGAYFKIVFYIYFELCNKNDYNAMHISKQKT